MTTIKVRGYEIEIAEVGRDADVTIRKEGAVVVVGMFDAGGLTLSDHSPTGARVSLKDSLVDAFEDRIREALGGTDSGDDEE